MIAYLPTLIFLALGLAPAVWLIVHDFRRWRRSRRGARPLCLPCAEPMREAGADLHRCESCGALRAKPGSFEPVHE